MAIKVERKNARFFVDPLSITADIEILSGNNVQVYNRETQEYIPSREFVPLVMLPSVTAVDPHNVQNGKQTLTGVEWYEGAPKADGSNRITNNAEFAIGDGTVQGFPKFALKCEKNISCDKPIEVYAIIMMVDKRQNKEIRIERSKKLYTSYHDAMNYSVKIDKPTGWTINPLAVKPNADGAWLYTINAQLYSGKVAVPDAHAAYWWEIKDKGVWREINADDLSMWIDCKDAQGNFTKSLTFDARLIDGLQAFRARAAYYETTRPASPSTEELQACTVAKLEMPPSITAETIQTKGIRITPDIDSTVGFEVIISDNKGLIGADKDYLFNITWFAGSDKPGTPEVKLGLGRTVEFIPKQLGFDPAYGFYCYPEVKLYAGHAAVIMPGATPDVEPSVVRVNGVPCLVPTFV